MLAMAGNLVRVNGNLVSRLLQQKEILIFYIIGYCWWVKLIRNSLYVL